MCPWGKVVCVINPWNLAVSQSNESCSVCSISFDFEHPFVPNQSPIFWYLHFVYFSPDPLLIILFISFLIAICQFCLSSSTGLCHASWNVLGSVGPDVTAEIRQVSFIQSSIVNSALSIDSFLGDIISFVWLLVIPNSSSNIIPRFCFSHSFWRLLFSPLLSSLIYFTSIPYLALIPLIHMGIMTI